MCNMKQKSDEINAKNTLGDFIMFQFVGCV